MFLYRSTWAAGSVFQLHVYSAGYVHLPLPRVCCALPAGGGWLLFQTVGGPFPAAAAAAVSRSFLGSDNSRGNGESSAGTAPANEGNVRRLPSKPSHRHLLVRRLYVRRWRGRPGKKYIFYLIFSSVRYFSVRHSYPPPPQQAKSSTTITIYTHSHNTV